MPNISTYLLLVVVYELLVVSHGSNKGKIFGTKGK